MKKFAALFEQLDQTNKTNVKVEILKKYFEEADDADKMWTMALFSHRKPRRQVNSTMLRQWAVEAADLPMWLFEESYHVVGDLAETVALLLPPPVASSDRSLSEWIAFLKGIGKLPEEERKEAIMGAWQELTSQERLVFTKLTTGSFRIGVSQNLMVRALSEVTAMEPAALAHRIMGNWDPDEITFDELIYDINEQDDISRPYPFFLAHPVEDVESLGDPLEWQAEWKWDGIRSQIIKRHGEFYVWSRGEELVTDKFPELVKYRNIIPDGTVLDGEILPFINGHPLPFGVLQTRIGRKNITAKNLKEAPVVFCAYDLMEWEGKDVRQEPLSHRRELLQSLVSECSADCFIFSDKVPFATWEELREIREKSRENYAEGLMLKRLSSAYQVGRKRGDWWKWKVEPMSIDGVLIYAQKGHGRRADLYTDYTFAVWNGDQLVPFTKAYSGLTDQEMRQVDAFVKKNTREKFGPVRTVTPQLVMEIGFEGIQASSRHKSGVALRFPRILRWRHDKKIEEADTLDSLKDLLKIYNI
jgi:DNA ligase-1